MESASFPRNKYWVLRHGKSIPNERGIIVSSMENGRRPEFQLGSEGVNQAELAGKLFLKELETRNIALDNVRICYSPFSRTSHTAKIVATVLNLPFEEPQCKAMDNLRERYFGPSFELKSHDKARVLECVEILDIQNTSLVLYAEIWDIDEQDPLVGPEGGESVKDVACRLASALVSMESEYEGCAILVVSHGDPLQILQTILSAANQHKESTSNDLVSRLEAIQVVSILSQHRKFALLTGEFRAVI